MIWIVYILNLAISAFNAWAVGKFWVETKAAGGMARLMAWCGAVMSASGFTWCYLVLVAKIGVQIPGKYHLPEPWAIGVFELGYLIIILSVIGSGLAITVQSWAHFWRERSLASGAVAGWNTFADIYNIASAMRGVPDAVADLGKLFSGGSKAEDDDVKSLVVLVVVGLALLCVLGGILTTTWIIRSTARNHARDIALELLQRKAATAS